MNKFLLGLLIICFVGNIAYAIDGWPNGFYTLPMADDKCPGDPGTWDFGWRYQDTENKLFPGVGGNEWSSPNNLAGDHSKDSMTWNFCSKGFNEVNSTFTWGTGKYCIMKKGLSCPNDFEEGSVLWDDDNTNNKNAKDGVLPEGVYDEDTKIYFCCRADGNTIVPLKLPNTIPFILFMQEQANCQNVEGMIDSQQWFKWDGEDDLIDLTRYFDGSVPFHDGSKNNHKIHFCYYS